MKFNMLIKFFIIIMLLVQSLSYIFNIQDDTLNEKLNRFELKIDADSKIITYEEVVTKSVLVIFNTKEQDTISVILNDDEEKGGKIKNEVTDKGEVKFRDDVIEMFQKTNYNYKWELGVELVNGVIFKIDNCYYSDAFVSISSKNISIKMPPYKKHEDDQDEIKGKKFVDQINKPRDNKHDGDGDDDDDDKKNSYDEEKIDHCMSLKIIFSDKRNTESQDKVLNILKNNDFDITLLVKIFESFNKIQKEQKTHGIPTQGPFNKNPGGAFNNKKRRRRRNLH
jgi:hypothetical protein